MTLKFNPIFGRIEPTNRDHETKYAFRSLMLPTAMKVEKTFPNAFISNHLQHFSGSLQIYGFDRDTIDVLLFWKQLQGCQAWWVRWSLT